MTNEAEVAVQKLSSERAVHFVGFRGDEYHRARRVFGTPDFIHIGWDCRARREIADGDTIVFARGPHDQEPAARNFDDIIEATHVPAVTGAQA